MIKLTAKQILEIDEIVADKQAIERVLEIHVNFAQNQLSDIIKDEIKWWEDVMELYDLDKDKKYTIRRENGFVQIVEKEDL